MFYPINGIVDAHEGDGWRAARARESFVQQFGLSIGSFLPLLTFDVGAARSGAPPWAVAA